MKNIVFEKKEGRNQFSFKDENGTDFCFEYYPSINGLWHNLNTSDFDVQLLIHPFLNKESNVFVLESNLGERTETVGFIFPVSVLDSDSFETNRDADNNYLFVAYKVLLERLDEIKQSAVSLAECFEDNICVCVLNRRTIGPERGIWSCIHSLRKCGYSYFVANNNYKEVEGYTINMYKELIPSSKIYVDFFIPSMYSDPIIDGIIRALPKADNLVYRFILLYQIIEFLISKSVSTSINEAISAYKTVPSCSENDFLEKINHIRKERGVINEIWDNCKISSAGCSKLFNQHCKHLYDMANVATTQKDGGDLFYSFRNFMVHSYRHLNPYIKELADTIFYFEQVVLTIVEKYFYSIST